MRKMFESIKNNPVRVFNILIATLAIVTFYIPEVPDELLLNLFIAILGFGGEVVRNHVTPTRKL